MLKAKNMLNEINLGLSALQAYIASYSSLNYSDMNIATEDVVADVLNSLFGWRLVNANKIKPNHECIDLLDPERRIGVQVTSQKGSAKINETLACICCHGLNLKRLVVFSLIPRQKGYTIKPNILDFAHKHDVIDVSCVIAHASGVSIEVLTELHLKIKGHMPFLTGAFSGDLDALIRVHEDLNEKAIDGDGFRKEIIRLVKDKQLDLAKEKLDDHARQVLKDTGGMLYGVADLYTLIDPLKAELFYRKAATLHAENAASGNLHGLNLMRLGQLDEAEKTFKSCLVLTDLTRLHRQHINGNLGLLAKKRSRYPEAIGYLRSALKLTEKKNKEGYANHFNNLGSCYNNLAKYGRAGKCLNISRVLIDEAIELEGDIDERNRLKLKKSNMLTNTAIQLRYLAATRNEPTLLLDAKKLLIDAIDIAELLKAKTELTRHYGNLSNVYRDMGDYPRARSYLAKSHECAISNDDHYGVLNNLVNLGYLMILDNDLDEAGRNLEAALVQEAERYPHLRAEIFGSFSLLYKAQGLLERSKESYKLAAEIYERIDRPETLKQLSRELSKSM